MYIINIIINRIQKSPLMNVKLQQNTDNQLKVSKKQSNMHLQQKSKEDKNTLSKNHQQYQLYGVTRENIDYARLNRVLFVANRPLGKAPSHENYWNMLKFICCINYKFFSVTAFFVLVYLSLFTAQCILGLEKDRELLQINVQTIILLGGNVPRLMKQGQVWRLITASLLHINFMHLLSNVLFILILSSRIQYTLGSLRISLIYILSAIGGNIFSALIQYDSVKAGASTSIYGLIAWIVGYLIINWKGLQMVGKTLRCQIVISATSMIIFIGASALIMIGQGNIDHYGHLGGFLVGFFASCLGKTLRQNKREKILRIVFGIIMIVELLIFFTLFFTNENVSSLKDQNRI